MHSSHCQLFCYTNLRLTNKYAQQNDIQLFIFQGSPRKDFYYNMGFRVCQQKLGINLHIFTKNSFLPQSIFFDYGGADFGRRKLCKKRVFYFSDVTDQLLFRCLLTT